MSLGLGAYVGKEQLFLDTHQDKENNLYPNISQMGFIILRGKSSEIRKTLYQARDHKIEHTVFLNTMTRGNHFEQLARTKESLEADLIYYGCVLWGDWDAVSVFTKRYSLWK